MMRGATTVARISAAKSGGRSRITLRSMRATEKAPRDQRQAQGEVSDIVRRIPDGRPSGSTIHRLEGGEPIRVTNARRVFDVINAALNNTLDASKELKVK